MQAVHDEIEQANATLGEQGDLGSLLHQLAGERIEAGNMLFRGEVDFRVVIDASARSKVPSGPFKIGEVEFRCGPQIVKRAIHAVLADNVKADGLWLLTFVGELAR